MVYQEQNQASCTLSDRRAEPRIKAGHSVLLKTPHAHPMEAWLLNVSSTGALARVPERISVGERVRIEAEGILLFGTVSRCETVDRANQVGIAFAVPLEQLHDLQVLNSALLEPENA